MFDSVPSIARVASVSHSHVIPSHANRGIRCRAGASGYLIMHGGDRSAQGGGAMRIAGAGVESLRTGKRGWDGLKSSELHRREAQSEVELSRFNTSLCTCQDGRLINVTVVVVVLDRTAPCRVLTLSHAPLFHNHLRRQRHPHSVRSIHATPTLEHLSSDEIQPPNLTAPESLVPHETPHARRRL